MAYEKTLKPAREGDLLSGVLEDYEISTRRAFRLMGVESIDMPLRVPEEG